MIVTLTTWKFTIAEMPALESRMGMIGPPSAHKFTVIAIAS